MEKRSKWKVNWEKWKGREWTKETKEEMKKCTGIRMKGKNQGKEERRTVKSRRFVSLYVSFVYFVCLRVSFENFLTLFYCELFFRFVLRLVLVYVLHLALRFWVLVLAFVSRLFLYFLVCVLFVWVLVLVLFLRRVFRVLGFKFFVLGFTLYFLHFFKIMWVDEKRWRFVVFYLLSLLCVFDNF